MSIKRRAFLTRAGLAAVGASCASNKSLARTAVGGGERRIEVDPYRNVDWKTIKQLKTNLHTHTRNSDGRMPPNQVIDEYHLRGYDALAITDHNKVTYPWSALDQINTEFENRDASDLGMLSIVGNELSRHHHTLSLFTDFTHESRDWEEVLTALGAYSPEARAIVCHPAMHWPRKLTSSAEEVKIALHPELRKLTRDDFSLESWFRTSDRGRNILLGNYANNSPEGRGAANLELHTDNRVRLYVQPVTGTTTDLTVSAGAVDTRDGQWHHLVGLRRDGQVVLYLDGREVGAREYRSGAFDLLGSEIYLGRDYRGGSTTLTGELGTVRLWKTGLSEQDVALLAEGDTAEILRRISAKSSLLAEYRFGGNDDLSLKAGSFSGLLSDTGGCADGPFNALAKAINVVAESAQAPVRHALRFSEKGKLKPLPKNVPEDIVDSYVDVFKRYGYVRAIEVANGTRPLTEYPLDRGLWDALLIKLMPRRPIWGMAVDDMHSMRHLGNDWANFLTSEISVNAIRQALDAGAYTFSSKRLKTETAVESDEPPRVNTIAHNAADGTIKIEASANGSALPESAYAWISMGRVVQIGSQLNYRRTAEIGCYARAEISAPGGVTFINPYGFA